METKNNLTELVKKLEAKGVGTAKGKYKKLGLQFNPFPKTGAADINSPDSLLAKLGPVDEEISAQIISYISDSLLSTNPSSDDKYLSAVIRGNYGSGKTQMLLYIKYLIEALPKDIKNPYVIYIENPGIRPIEMIGSIINEIGAENFRKYIWNKILNVIKTDESIQVELNNYADDKYSLFQDNSNVFNPEYLINYKSFLDNCTKRIIKPQKQKLFVEKLRNYIIEKLANNLSINDLSVAGMFFELMAGDLVGNKAWEILSTGQSKILDGKEVDIIKSIINLIEEQGFTDFYILVDEFEDVTEGRLTKIQADKYLSTLRTLIDKNRNWCTVFAMTGKSLVSIKKISPPLSDRISSRIIDIKNLTYDLGVKLVKQYLSIANDSKGLSISPFDESAIQYLTDRSPITRLFLRNCFYLLERASDELKKNEVIDENFVKKHSQYLDFSM